MSTMMSGKRTTVIVILLNILIFLALYWNPGHLILHKPGLDWFEPEGRIRYKVFSLEYIFIAEALLAGGALYLVR